MIKVKKLEPDYWGRPRLQNVETKTIYSDISLGNDPYTKLNIPGDWYIVCPSGEPDYPLPEGVVFELVGEPTPIIKIKRGSN